MLKPLKIALIAIIALIASESLSLNFNTFELQVNTDNDSAWVTFLPSELTFAPTYMTEVVDGDDYDLTIALPETCWTMTSFNLQPTYAYMESIFVDIEVDSIEIENYNYNHGRRYNDNWTWVDEEGQPTNRFFWNMHEGYNVWTNDDAELAVSNTFWYGISAEIDFTTGEDSVFYIAYTPCWDMPCDEAFDMLLHWGTPPYDTSTVLIWACNTDGVYYMPERPNPKIFNMRQGEGYILQMETVNDISNFQFTTETSPPLENVPGKPGGENSTIQSITTSHYKYKSRTQDFYPVVLKNIEIEGVIPTAGDEIGLFMWDTLCVGAKKFSNDSILIIPAWEDDIMTPEVVDGYIEEQVISFKFWDDSEAEEFDLTLNPTILGVEENMGLAYSTQPFFGRKNYALISFCATPCIEIPETFLLHQNYPNPFNPATTIRFDLPEASKVKLVIYNILGQQVAVLKDDILNAGYKSVRWDSRSDSGAEVASGLYLYSLEVKGLSTDKRFNEVKKMILVK